MQRPARSHLRYGAVVAVAFLLAGLIALAHVANADPSADPGVLRATLPNGLRVYLKPVPGAPVCPVTRPTPL